MKGDTRRLIVSFFIGVMHIVTMVAFAKGLILLKKYKEFSLAGVAGVLPMFAYTMPMAVALTLFMVNCKSKNFDG